VLSSASTLEMLVAVIADTLHTTHRTTRYHCPEDHSTAYFNDRQRNFNSLFLIYLTTNSISNIDVRSKAFAAAKIDKIFPGYQPCKFVKNYRRFRNYLCSRHQGLMVGTEMVRETSIIGTN
jgi:hypothetical protein